MQLCRLLVQRQSADHDHAADQQAVGVAAIAFGVLGQADGAALPPMFS
jgi:hypothetical protein